jgi:hypothetical protein
MSSVLSPIPSATRIVDSVGAITTFFRLRWQELVDRAGLSATVASFSALTKTAAYPATNIYTTTTAAMHRVSYGLLRTVDDTVASSLTVTIAWTQNGVARSHAFDALTELVAVNTQSQSFPFYADANTPVTIAVAYASTTPNKATYDLRGSVEQLAA